MDRESQVRQNSKIEGSRLAGLYEHQTDQRIADQQVHDALLQDAIKNHHSELNLDIVRRTLQEETAKAHDRNVIIKNEDYRTVRNYQLPVIDLQLEGRVLYDPIEAAKVIAEDDARRDQNKKPAQSALLPNFNPFEGFGIPAAMGMKPEKK